MPSGKGPNLRQSAQEAPVPDKPTDERDLQEGAQGQDEKRLTTEE